MELYQPHQLTELVHSGLVAHVEHHRQLASSNDLALTRAGDECRLPCLFVVERQLAGRGRGGNRWWGPPGAVMFSLLLDTQAAGLPPETWPRVSLAVGMAICRGLRGLVPEANVRVKWPNDVYLDGRKLAGVLVEPPRTIKHRLVLGAGVNVTNSFAAAPPELRQTATSLGDALAGRNVPSPFAVLRAILTQLHGIAEQLQPPELLPHAWNELCFLSGRTVTVTSEHHQVTGICHGIDHRGALLLATARGMESLLAGTVTLE